MTDRHNQKLTVSIHKICVTATQKSNSTAIIYLITHTNTCTYTHTHTYIYIYYLRSLKFTLKHLKCSYMFRSHDHPQGAYTVPL